MTSQRLHAGQISKVVYSTLYSFAGFTGILYLILKKRRDTKTKQGLIFNSIGWIISCFALGLATAFLHGGEFLERPLIYGFIPLSTLASLNYKNKYGKTLLISILLIGTPLSIVAAYTNEYFEYSPMSDSYGALFMFDHGIKDLRNVKAVVPVSLVVQFQVLRSYYEHDVDLNATSFNQNTVYIWSLTSERYFSIFIKGRKLEFKPEIWPRLSWIGNWSIMVSQPKSNLIYSNGNFELLLTTEST